MARRFTLVEAQGLLPRVEALLRQAIELKSEYQAAEETVQAFAQRVSLMGGMLVNREQVIDARSRRDEAGAQLKIAIEQVQEFGCVVKDLDIGLIDFPTLLRGVEVYLCWKLGEPAIAWWHGVEEGFRGRKAIDQDFLDHHRGDRAQ
ncbi:MAG TPA: DUF2203 domain-containing protein [Bryobacteraceae bacterium]|nr:DUF2203 domain-containing protein [Bryobacteraceae bacterium]